MCDQLAWNLNREFGSSAIHGDKKQQERDHVLAAFKVSNWETPIPVDALVQSATLKQSIDVLACSALQREAAAHLQAPR